MKKIRLKILLISLLLVLIGSSSKLWAVPNLQIYIPGAIYENETWIINAYEYELWVIGANLDIDEVKFAAAVPEGEDGSVNVSWHTPSAPDYGIGSNTIVFKDPDLEDDPYRMEYSIYRDSYKNGLPDPETYGFGSGFPLDGNDKPLPPHGVFPTDFYEYYVGGFETIEPVINYVDGSGNALGEIKKFDISVSGYTWVDIIAYDHYEKANGKAQYLKTPFSHDGASGEPIPEPATMILLGSGLIGLAGVRRKKFKT